jgi:3-oxoacyl-[acyl-carrier protein] reductase
MSDFNISVNCIAPGPIKTDLIRGVSEKKISKVISNQIFQKQFTPDDVCDLVEMLVGDSAQTLSGQVFHVGGV